MDFSNPYLSSRMRRSWFKFLLFFFFFSPLSSNFPSISSTPPQSPKNMEKKENRAKDEGKRKQKRKKVACFKRWSAFLTNFSFLYSTVHSTQPFLRLICPPLLHPQSSRECSPPFLKIISRPNMGLELTTSRSRVSCSKDQANHVPLGVPFFTGISHTSWFRVPGWLGHKVHEVGPCPSFCLCFTSTFVCFCG